MQGHGERKLAKLKSKLKAKLQRPHSHHSNRSNLHVAHHSHPDQMIRDKDLDSDIDSYPTKVTKD